MPHKLYLVFKFPITCEKWITTAEMLQLNDLNVAGYDDVLAVGDFEGFSVCFNFDVIRRIWLRCDGRLIRFDISYLGVSLVIYEAAQKPCETCNM